MRRLALFVVALVALALSGCSFFRAAEKDPATALRELQAGGEKLKADTVKGCKAYAVAEALDPKLRDPKLDKFCAELEAPLPVVTITLDPNAPDASVRVENVGGAPTSVPAPE